MVLNFQFHQSKGAAPYFNRGQVLEDKANLLKLLDGQAT